MRALTLALLIALSTPALSAVTPELCSDLSDTAGTIMQKRQEGVAMVRIMDLMGDSKIMQEIVVEAYEVRRHPAPFWQDREINDFRDKWYLTCYKLIDDAVAS